MSMHNEFDAFSQGVEPGGLRSKTQIKLLINYLVANIKEPISTSIIIEALQLHGLANYFEVTQAIDDLVENGNLSESDGMLYITPKGILSLSELAEELPNTVKEIALADALKLLLIEKRESENTVDIQKTDNGYFVTFRVMHKSIPLMELTVYAADYEQAEQLKSNFLRDPVHVYSTVAASLFI